MTSIYLNHLFRDLVCKQSHSELLDIGISICQFGGETIHPMTVSSKENLCLPPEDSQNTTETHGWGPVRKAEFNVRVS